MEFPWKSKKKRETIPPQEEQVIYETLHPRESLSVYQNVLEHEDAADIPEAAREIHVCTPHVVIAARSDYGGPGSKYAERGKNEDTMFCGLSLDGTKSYFGVIDGAGGHADGLLTSVTVNTALDTALRYNLGINGALVGAREDSINQNGEACGVFGTIDENLHVQLFSVGDSQCLTFRQGVIMPEGTTQLHNIAAMIRTDATTGQVQKDYYNHPRKNNILSTFKTVFESEQDFNDRSRNFDAQEGDIMVLVSDGVNDLVTQYEIQQIVAAGNGDTEKIRKELYELAYTRNNSNRNIDAMYGPNEPLTINHAQGHGDNITVQVVRVAGSRPKVEVQQQQVATPAKEINPKMTLNLLERKKKQEGIYRRVKNFLLTKRQTVIRENLSASSEQAAATPVSSSQPEQRTRPEGEQHESLAKWLVKWWEKAGDMNAWNLVRPTDEKNPNLFIRTLSQQTRVTQKVVEGVLRATSLRTAIGLTLAGGGALAGGWATLAGAGLLTGRRAFGTASAYIGFSQLERGVRFGRAERDVEEALRQFETMAPPTINDSDETAQRFFKNVTGLFEALQHYAAYYRMVHGTPAEGHNAVYDRALERYSTVIQQFVVENFDANEPTKSVEQVAAEMKDTLAKQIALAEKKLRKQQWGFRAAEAVAALAVGSGAWLQIIPEEWRHAVGERLLTIPREYWSHHSFGDALRELFSSGTAAEHVARSFSPVNIPYHEYIQQHPEIGSHPQEWEPRLEYDHRVRSSAYVQFLDSHPQYAAGGPQAWNAFAEARQAGEIPQPQATATDSTSLGKRLSGLVDEVSDRWSKLKIWPSEDSAQSTSTPAPLPESTAAPSTSGPIHNVPAAPESTPNPVPHSDVAPESGTPAPAPDVRPLDTPASAAGPASGPAAEPAAEPLPAPDALPAATPPAMEFGLHEGKWHTPVGDFTQQQWEDMTVGDEEGISSVFAHPTSATVRELIMNKQITINGETHAVWEGFGKGKMQVWVKTPGTVVTLERDGQLEFLDAQTGETIAPEKYGDYFEFKPTGLKHVVAHAVDGAPVTEHTAAAAHTSTPDAATPIEPAGPHVSDVPSRPVPSADLPTRETTAPAAVPEAPERTLVPEDHTAPMEAPIIEQAPTIPEEVAAFTYAQPELQGLDTTMHVHINNEYFPIRTGPGANGTLEHFYYDAAHVKHIMTPQEVVGVEATYRQLDQFDDMAFSETAKTAYPVEGGVREGVVRFLWLSREHVEAVEQQLANVTPGSADYARLNAYLDMLRNTYHNTLEAYAAGAGPTGILQSNSITVPNFLYAMFDSSSSIKVDPVTSKLDIPNVFSATQAKDQIRLGARNAVEFILKHKK